jgi:predicted Zn-dependent protease
LTFSDDISFGDVPVKAGTYALYTIPGKSTWTVMLYSDLTLGGNTADYKQEKEVARISVPAKYTEAKTESFTINIAKVKPTTATLELLWENTRVPIKIATEIDGKVMKNIDAAMANDTRPYFQSASYYFDNNKDLGKAKMWVEKATEQNPKAYWVRLLKAKIELKMGDKKAAIATANEVVAMATEAKNDDYVKMAKELIAKATN